MPDYGIVVSAGIIRELEKISSGTKRNAKDAKVALEMIRKGGFRVQEEDYHVDDWIIKEALSGGTTVCTNDTALASSLRESGVRVVSIGKNGRLR